MEEYASMENVDADQVLVALIVTQRVSYARVFNDFIGQVPSRILWYFLIFAIMLAIIGGIIFYTVKVRGQMKSHPALDDDPNSVIGADPEPKRKGRFGF
jgi:hypothetical protein